MLNDNVNLISNSNDKSERSVDSRIDQYESRIDNNQSEYTLDDIPEDIPVPDLVIIDVNSIRYTETITNKIKRILFNIAMVIMLLAIVVI